MQKLSKEQVVNIAVRDASARTGVGVASVETVGVEDASFANAALGAPRGGEMSFDMVTAGWRIRLEAGGQRFEYRADGRQVRLVGYEGRNHLVFPL
jgi:hypothetical protein